MIRLTAKFKRVTTALMTLVFFQANTFAWAQTDGVSEDFGEAPAPSVETPQASQPIVKDDNLYDPRGNEFVSKWLKPGQYMPVSEIKQGMKGYGLTVFQGTKIEKFDVTVIGVVKKVLSGRDAVMVRLSGEALGKNTVIRGMSGSPVYIDGKLIGAVSYGFDFSREPIVGVTPIVDMLDAMTPDNRKDMSPVHLSSRTQPINTEFSPDTNFENNLDKASSITTTSGGGQKMVPLIAPIALTGFSQRAEEFLGDRFKPFGLSVSSGAAGAMDEALGQTTSPGKENPSDAIMPGGAVAVLLVTGDLSASATGTATTNFGGNVLAFGHPFMSAGPVDFPMATAHIHQVLPNLAVSFKVASPVKLVGSVTNDRPWSIGGKMGRFSKMIPVTYTVSDRSRGVKKVFNLNIINHADMTPELIASTAVSAIDTTHQSNSPYVVSVHTKIITDKAGTIERNDKFPGNFSAHAPVDGGFKLKGFGDSVGASLLSMLTRITNNDFEKVAIKGVTLEIGLDDGHETARIERIALDKQQVEPGETVAINATIRPYNKSRLEQLLTVKIPRDVPDGNLLIGVGAGDQIDQLRRRMGISDPLPENLSQVVNRIREQGQGNALEAVLALPEQSIFLDGRRLVSPPATWIKMFSSDRYTKGPQLVKGEVRTKAIQPWLLDGLHLLAVEVKSKEKALAQTAPYTITPVNSYQAQDGVYMTDQARKALDASGSRKPDGSHSASSPMVLTSAVAAAQAAATAAAASEKAATTATPSSSFAPAKQYPHMRSTLSWKQVTEEDFRNGKTEEAALDSRGRLSPALKQAARTKVSPEMQVWSIQPFNDTIYLAAQNKILAWTGDTQAPSLVTKLNCSFIPAIAVDSKGTIYAAAAPGNKVYAIRSGKPETLFQTGNHTVTSICCDQNGNLYAGVAGEGLIWKYDLLQKTAKVIFDSGQAHVTSLWFSKAEKRLYIGTGEKGAVYSIDGSGNAKAEYQTSDHIVTGAVKDSRGNLYVTTAGQGHFLRIKPNGEVDTLASSEAFYALAHDPSTDAIYAGDAEGDITQAKQEDVTDRAYFSPVAHTEQEAVSALVSDGRGHLLAATSNFGGCLKFELTPSSKASYTSQIRDAQRPSKWSKIIPYGTHSDIDPDLMRSLNITSRTGNSSQPDASWSAWTAAQPAQEGFIVLSPQGRYLQYKLHWKVQEKPTKSTKKGRELDTVRKIEVTYLPNNSSPAMSSVSLQAGAHLSGKQEIAVTASDPDKDNMLLTLELSNDDGKTWTTLASDLRSKKEKDLKDKKDAKVTKEGKIAQESKDQEAGKESKESKDAKTTSDKDKVTSDSEVKEKSETSEKSEDSEKSESESKGSDAGKTSSKLSTTLAETTNRKPESPDSKKVPDNTPSEKDKQLDKPKTDGASEAGSKEKPNDKASAEKSTSDKAAIEKALSKSTGSNAALVKALLKTTSTESAESASESFTYSWDTTKQKDGHYVVRIKVDDRLSNPKGYLDHERWGAVIVDNTNPEVSDIAINVDQNGDSQLELKASDKLSSITNATYRIDDGAPFAMMAIADDGSQQAADSQNVHLRAVLKGVKSGPHKFVLEITDRAGNTETKSVTMSVK